MENNITNEGVVNNSSQPSQKMNYIIELLHELLELKVDNKILINEISYENCDMEQYEGTPVEDLVNCSYLSGKKDMIEEIIELLENEI
jgi:hypothetical protein|tara:strand:+ start:126 stop:389 length:264 start_codon:yes stop_codon:yes gene_type:complete